MQMSPAKADMRDVNPEHVEEFLVLYGELISFRDTAEFRQKQYCCGTYFSKWARRVVDLNKRVGREFVQEMGVAPYSLFRLGRAYSRGNQNTKEFRELERMIVVSLSAAPKEGYIKTIVGDLGCRSTDDFIKSFELAVKDKWDARDRMLQKNCRRVLQNETLKGPIETRVIKLYPESKDTSAYYLVEHPQHGKLWISKGLIE